MSVSCPSTVASPRFGEEQMSLLIFKCFQLTHHSVTSPTSLPLFVSVLLVGQCNTTVLTTIYCHIGKPLQLQIDIKSTITRSSSIISLSARCLSVKKKKKTIFAGSEVLKPNIPICLSHSSVSFLLLQPFFSTYFPQPH